MELSHNVTFKIIDDEHAGHYRVVLEEIRLGKLIVVRLDPPVERDSSKGGRKKKETTRRPRKKAPLPLVGDLIWLERNEIYRLLDKSQLVITTIEPENITLSDADEKLYARRKQAMAPFLDFVHMREQILLHKGISGLLAEVKAQSGVSSTFVYRNFSNLCRNGFHEIGLKPRLSKCGAPNIPRPCDPGQRKKPGAKTINQNIAKAFGHEIPDVQPGLSSAWTAAILAADAAIHSPKPKMPERVTRIISSAFVTRYREEGGKLIEITPDPGTYPNRRQIQRVLKRDISRLQELLNRTTKGHFNRSLRGLIARNWQGVAGPGHTWAIDSTVGDIYLRSSIDRAWILGRPIVYVIVDIWSTAVVGFHVCLTGPSWNTAKQALFSSAAPIELIGELWGYRPVQSLTPEPTMPAVLLCDRGEYLSKAASITGANLIPCLSYTPPYRPDLKGLVEVLHRIEKDRMFYFTPGAIDERRKEYELRRFRPDDAVLTVAEFSLYLHTIFTQYNLSAPRDHRIDAHMAAAGVFPSPAGLWRAGHEMGIGVRRPYPLSTLITDLLPSEKGSVTRQGVRFAGKEYFSDVVRDEAWTALARNFGAWEIDCQYFPGSVSRIWTPNIGGCGLLDLRISDQSTASPELSFDEALDATMYAKRQSAEVAHIRMIEALRAQRTLDGIIARARQATSDAEAVHSGSKPTSSEARRMEAGLDVESPQQPMASPTQNHDEAEAAHLDMMRAIYAAAND